MSDQHGCEDVSLPLSQVDFFLPTPPSSTISISSSDKSSSLPSHSPFFKEKSVVSCYAASSVPSLITINWDDHDPREYSLTPPKG